MAFRPAVKRRLVASVDAPRRRRLLFDDDFSYHVVVHRSTDDAAVHGISPCPIGLKFNLCRLPLLDWLIDPEGIHMESVLSISRRDHKKHPLPALHVHL